MTNILKASALTLSLAGAFALGVWTAPHFADDSAPSAPASIADGENPGVPGVPGYTVPAKTTAATPAAAATAATAEPVQLHAKSLLKAGADPMVAAEGFSDAVTFVSVAHAAKNTDIPFMLLKHRVLNQGQPLSQAIRASRPELDSVLESNRARAEARADLARLSS